MTEQEWLTCADWREMFEFIEGKVSDRKLRLFAVACCRRTWQFLNEESRSAVEIAEKYADGLASLDELRAVVEIFRAAEMEFPQVRYRGHRCKDDVGGFTANEDAFFAARSVMRQSADLVAWSTLRATGRDFTATELGNLLTMEMQARRQVLHHILGPFLFRVSSTPTSLPHAIASLADAQYYGQDCCFALHDALLEAGHPELADHFLQEKHHPKGCWGLDLILGKK